MRSHASSDNANLCSYLDLQSQPIDDVAELRKELQGTATIYHEASEDLVHAKKKVSDL
jgi:hypothetical protein